jgi:hypothetical protein
MKFPKYVLSASGSVTAPHLDIILRSDDHELAIEHAKEIAGRLFEVGYFAFDVFEVSPDGDKFNVGLRVERPAPVVIVCKR